MDLDSLTESLNARKTFMCALYSHEKRLQKAAPGSQGRLPKTAPGAAAPENGSGAAEVQSRFFGIFCGSL